MDCKICERKIDESTLICPNEWCNEVHAKCSKCGVVKSLSDMYEYRGAEACEDCIDEVAEMREFERQEIIKEEHNKTKCFKGLDLGDNAIGKANREILKSRIEIASKESGRLKGYEGR